VKAGNSSSTGRKGVFQTTRWSLILNSVDGQAPECRTALSELCKLYWYPLYAFARRSGHDAADAEDLTQSFFLHLLEKEALSRVGPEKGRFRSFLLASFKNHMSVSRHRNRAAKRGEASKSFPSSVCHLTSSGSARVIARAAPRIGSWLQSSVASVKSSPLIFGFWAQ
jgi:DNA-directed RNA polymerase specialized sigma24 family protein